MVKISNLSLYIINRVIYRSYVIGLLQEKLSGILRKASGYVNNTRNQNNDAIFSPADYRGLADALGWETHDLLPPANTPYTDGTLVDKIVFTLRNFDNTKEVLLGMIDNKYFDTPKSLEDIYNHLYLVKNSADPEKRKVVLDVLTKLTESGNLKLDKDKYSI